MREKCIAIVQHKGGVGKTTSCLNLGSALAKQGFKVLLIDVDPQSNLTSSFEIDEKTTESIGQWLLGDLDFDDVVVHKGNIDIVPSSYYLSTQEKLIAAETGSEQFLRVALTEVKKQYDFIFIDCPPNLGTMTANALCASDYYLVPFQAEFFSYKGLKPLLTFTKKIQDRINQNLVMGGIFLTKYNHNTRTKIHKDVAEKLRSSSVGESVFHTYIRVNSAVVEAPMVFKSIFDYAPKSNGATDYMNLSLELISRI